MKANEDVHRKTDPEEICCQGHALRDTLKESLRAKKKQFQSATKTHREK